MSEATNRIPLGLALVACLTCGHLFRDNTPSGRCPREAEHPEPIEITPTWTVVGVYNAADEPVAIAVIAGGHGVEEGDWGGDTWSLWVTAADADAARARGTAERKALDEVEHDDDVDA